MYSILFFRSSLFAIGLVASSLAFAHQNSNDSNLSPLPEVFAVKEKLSPLTGVTDLKFNELFKLPVGPKGLEHTQKLLDLDGKQVRVIGYMAKQENPVSGVFIITPIPVSMGDEDESFADDLPASAIFVHVDEFQQVTPYADGLIQIQGTLSVGDYAEKDGRISQVRVHLSPDLTNALMQTKVTQK